MKKLIIALATVTFIGLGGSAASAALPEKLPPGCSEPSNVPTDPCYDAELYPIEIKPPAGGGVEVAPPNPTATPAAAAPGSLPRTGSGVSPILGVGALLLAGGGIVVVASRRRSASAAAS